MSISFVNAKIFGPLKRAIHSNDATRKMVQSARGQILSITEAQIKAIHESVGLDKDVSDEIWKNLIRKINAEEALLNNNKDRERLEIVREFIIKNNIPNAKIVTTHAKLSGIKGEWIKEIEVATGKMLGAQWYELGHGIMGHAVSELSVLRGLVPTARTDPFDAKHLSPGDYLAIHKLQDTVISDVFGAVNTKKQVFRKRTGIELRADMRVTGEEISKSYVTVLTFQDRESNAAEGKLEKEQLAAVKDLFIKRFSDARFFFTASGSATLEEAITGVIHNSIKAKNAKVTGPKGSAKYTSEHKLSEVIETQHVIETTTIGKVRKRSNKPPTNSKPSKVNIVALLNTKLPQEIRSRMTYPRLVNRTGRFSESVQVLSADTTPKGGTSIAYTYQKDPYQLFERGRSRLATPDREPRDIIDASIRSIAQEMMLGRFYTRRV